MTASGSETLYFYCQACGVRLSVPASLAGVSGPCPSCGVMLVAPMASQPRRAVPIEGAVAKAAETAPVPPPTQAVEPAVIKSPVVLQRPPEPAASPEKVYGERERPDVGGKEVILPPRRSEMESNPSRVGSVSLEKDTFEDSMLSSKRVQLPPKKSALKSWDMAESAGLDAAAGDVSPVVQTEAFVPPQAEDSKLVWRPPVEPLPIDTRMVYLERPHGSTFGGRTRAFMVALLLLLAGGVGVALVFEDQLRLAWATYQMKFQNSTDEQAGGVAEFQSQDKPAVSATENEMIPENTESSTLADLPTAVADAVVIPPQPEVKMPSVPLTDIKAVPPAEGTQSVEETPSKWVPRSVPAETLIQSGAPFAVADAWVMQAPDSRPAFTTPVTPPPFLQDPPVEIRDAAISLREFLMAGTWQERLKQVQWPDDMRPLMERYYGSHDDGVIEVAEADLIPREPDAVDDGVPRQEVFLLAGKDIPVPLPVMVEQTSQGWKVDWLTFIEGKDQLLEKFYAEKGERAASFRVLVRRKRYFGDDVPDLDNKIGYEIQPPVQGFVAYAFAQKGTPLAQVLDRFLGWEVMSAAVVMELKWRKDGDSGWMEIVDLVHENWRSSKIGESAIK